MKTTALAVRSQRPVTFKRSLVAFLTTITCGVLFMTQVIEPTSTPSVSDVASSSMSWDEVLALLFMAAIGVAPFAAMVKHTAAQIFSRAVLLQLTCFGLLVVGQGVFFRPESDAIAGGILISLAGLLPLVILGSRGLGSNAGKFAPDAFRFTLLASLVFGLADTWALLFYTVMERGSVPMLASAGLMTVALFGLYRLKVWGLVVCVSANLLIAGLALSGVFDLPNILTYGLAATAGIQLLLPLPLIKAMIRK